MEEKELPIVEEDDFFDDVDGDGECPCEHCPDKGWCDQWEAMFCCTYCHLASLEHCEDCDPMDI